MQKKQSETNIFLCLGSNIGDSKSLLERAVELLLDEAPGGTLSFPGVEKPLRMGALSSIYLTEPQGYSTQPVFLNQIIMLQGAAGVEPEALLEHTQKIESLLGRTRHSPRYGPRVIDIDILLFGEMHYIGPELEIPHPRMLERAFVLVPLAEIAPDLLLPQGMLVRDALSDLRFTLRGRVIYQGASFSE